jgi:hypothetical protein
MRCFCECKGGKEFGGSDLFVGRSLRSWQFASSRISGCPWLIICPQILRPDPLRKLTSVRPISRLGSADRRTDGRLVQFRPIVGAKALRSQPKILRS